MANNNDKILIYKDYQLEGSFKDSKDDKILYPFKSIYIQTTQKDPKKIILVDGSGGGGKDPQTKVNTKAIQVNKDNIDTINKELPNKANVDLSNLTNQAGVQLYTEAKARLVAGANITITPDDAKETLTIIGKSGGKDPQTKINTDDIALNKTAINNNVLAITKINNSLPNKMEKNLSNIDSVGDTTLYTKASTRLVAGANVTITKDSAKETITIASAGGGGTGVTKKYVDDQDNLRALKDLTNVNVGTKNADKVIGVKKDGTLDYVTGTKDPQTKINTKAIQVNADNITKKVDIDLSNAQVDKSKSGKIVGIDDKGKIDFVNPAVTGSNWVTKTGFQKIDFIAPGQTTVQQVANIPLDMTYKKPFVSFNYEVQAQLNDEDVKTTGMLNHMSTRWKCYLSAYITDKVTKVRGVYVGDGGLDVKTFWKIETDSQTKQKYLNVYTYLTSNTSNHYDWWNFFGDTAGGSVLAIDPKWILVPTDGSQPQLQTLPSGTTPYELYNVMDNAANIAINETKMIAMQKDIDNKLNVDMTGLNTTGEKKLYFETKSQLVAGTNVTITPDDSKNTLTINSSGGGGSDKKVKWFWEDLEWQTYKWTDGDNGMVIKVSDFDNGISVGNIAVNDDIFTYTAIIANKTPNVEKIASHYWTNDTSVVSYNQIGAIIQDIKNDKILFQSDYKNIGNVQYKVLKTYGPNTYSGTWSTSIVRDEFLKIEEKVDQNEFENEKNITMINLPIALTIGESAFSQIDNLIEVTLPTAIVIDPKAFFACKITKLVMPKIQNVSQDAFSSAIITDLKIPDVTNIWENSFGQALLTSLDVPICNTISDGAFASSPFTYINAPQATTIGKNALASTVNDKSTKVTLLKQFDDKDKKDAIFGDWDKITFTWV